MNCHQRLAIAVLCLTDGTLTQEKKSANYFSMEAAVETIIILTHWKVVKNPVEATLVRTIYFSVTNCYNSL